MRTSTEGVCKKIRNKTWTLPSTLSWSHSDGYLGWPLQPERDGELAGGDAGGLREVQDAGSGWGHFPGETEKYWSELTLDIFNCISMQNFNRRRPLNISFVFTSTLRRLRGSPEIAELNLRKISNHLLNVLSYPDIFSPKIFELLSFKVLWNGNGIRFQSKLERLYKLWKLEVSHWIAQHVHADIIVNSLLGIHVIEDVSKKDS